jgi:hypothetical protein
MTCNLSPPLHDHLNGTQLWVRVKMVGKFFGNIGFIFSYFLVILYYSVNMTIGMKTRYCVMGIGRNTVGIPYGLFLNWVEKSGNFLDFLHYLSGLSCTVYLG